mgnify:CR=1 FL=1
MTINSGREFYSSIRREIEKEIELNRREKAVEEREKAIAEMERREESRRTKEVESKDNDIAFSSFEKAIKSTIELIDK